MRAKKLAILLLSVALAAMLTGCPWDQDEPSGSSSGSSSSSSSSRPDDGGDEDGGSSGSSSSSSSSSQPEAPVVERIQVRAGKTDYFYGEAVDKNDLTVTAYYSDGSEKAVTDYTVSPEKFEATGTQTVTVTYTSPAGDEFTATFHVTVHAKLTGISVLPDSLECFVNETIGKDDLTVTAHYNDNTSHEVTNFTVSPEKFEATGPQTATVTYTENGITETAAVSVTVKDKLTGISVVEKNKKEYDLYDSINKDDLTVTAHYIAGGDVTLNSSDFTVSPAEFTGEPGPQTVTVTYTENGVEATAEFTVTVNDPGYRITGNTYEVRTTEGLLAWNEAVQSDLSLNCTLTEDINMAGKTWTPVGSSFSPNDSYQGTFDGQGHSITGLAITINSTYGNATLFDYIGSNGTVKNLQVEVNYNVQQNGVAGGIAYTNYGTITACSVTGNITADAGDIGGIAVNNFDNGTITACWYNGQLQGHNIGGIISNNNNTVTACYWGGNAGQGVNSNMGGTVDATKVKDTTTWADAVEGMNAALGSNDYEWQLIGNTPTLVTRTSETILGRLEQLASHLR